MKPGLLYKYFKAGARKYDEEKHCKLLIKIMCTPNGTSSHFCVEAMISEDTFWTWVREHNLFKEIYSFCRAYARKLWEDEGVELKKEIYPIGTQSHAFEYWKLIGWSRFGISKNSRIKLNLNPSATPQEHYCQLLVQASEGDFTASEIKQLMEAVNVGLNAHQVFELQKEIDALKSDLALMKSNAHADNTIANKRITESN